MKSTRQLRLDFYLAHNPRLTRLNCVGWKAKCMCVFACGGGGGVVSHGGSGLSRPHCVSPERPLRSWEVTAPFQTAFGGLSMGVRQSAVTPRTATPYQPCSEECCSAVTKPRELTLDKWHDCQQQKSSRALLTAGIMSSASGIVFK